MSVTVGAALASVEERLSAAGCDTPRVDAEILLAHVLGTTRSALVAHRGGVVDDDAAAVLEPLVSRRVGREPLAYVLGEWGFRRLTLAVDDRALVPRPETEVLVERALARLAAHGVVRPRVLDVGTGSGAIALAIADEHPGARVLGIDVSEQALALARENAKRTGLAVELARHDLFSGLPGGPYDLVVSNPPYVRPDDLDGLAPEVRDFEPRAALVGERATEAIAAAAREVLAPDGGLVLETADDGAREVARLLGALGYLDVTVTKDLSGRERVVDALLAGP